jgi:hypothetical protein
MRLLDLVAHAPKLRPAGMRESPLPIPSDFAQEVLACPLRLVLNDDLIRCSTELGFADGDRVAGCSDLIRVPCERLWVEWNDVPRKTCLEQIAHLPPTGGVAARRAGALIRAHADGRSGEVRTFWSTPDDRVYCAALVADFDLDSEIRATAAGDLSIFDGGFSGVALLHEPAIDALLAHIRFRFEKPWLDYYRGVRLPESDQTTVLRSALGTSAFDLPMLFALFLLMSAKDGARRRAVNLDRLNRSRSAAGKFPLLEHIEVSSCIAGPYSAAGRSNGEAHLSRRLHHVRGHLARRGHTIYWRSPHLRGSARLGVIKTRTVELAFS